MRLIDADAVRQEIAEKTVGLARERPYKDNGAEMRGLRTAMDIIVSALTIDAEPVVHGHKVVAMREEIAADWTCSECETPICDDDCLCPNCGARMEET